MVSGLPTKQVFGTTSFSTSHSTIKHFGPHGRAAAPEPLVSIARVLSDTMFPAVPPRSEETPEAPVQEAQPSATAAVEGTPSETPTIASNVVPEPTGAKFEVVGAARSPQSEK